MSGWLMEETAVTEFEDTGCNESISCLSCPLPQCKHDDPAWYSRYKRLRSDLRVVAAMQSENLSMDETAERFSMTVRTIFRIMRRRREAIALS